MFGTGKPLSESTNGQIRGALFFCSLISFLVLGGSFLAKNQPAAFLWFVRAVGLLWLVQVWYRCLHELRQRKCKMSAPHTPSSPDPMPVSVDEHKHVLKLFRSSTFWGWCAVASFPAVGAGIYRACTSFAIGPVAGGLVIAVCICVLGVQSLLRGRIISNKGIFLRRSEPVRFWLSMALLLALYTLALIGILRI
jgi:hypothetical protein